MRDRMRGDMHDVVVMIIHHVRDMNMADRKRHIGHVVMERRCMPPAKRSHPQHGEERQQSRQHGGPGTVEGHAYNLSDMRQRSKGDEPRGIPHVRRIDTAGQRLSPHDPRDHAQPGIERRGQRDRAQAGNRSRVD
ncbi:hypothetical protein SPHINGO391_440430 [Sphingomonas aurantiaca]|uniref:Uncharacterized protein n=1 Tax=Sphingomonas aurantiaca TaxID=185949 RepID=A0A5E7ZB91_9SPHN|nr:hypothetical protein SPHINGO391_440430 [Sphingomonas aurantiaca]